VYICVLGNSKNTCNMELCIPDYFTRLEVKVSSYLARVGNYYYRSSDVFDAGQKQVDNLSNICYDIFRNGIRRNDNPH